MELKNQILETKRFVLRSFEDTDLENVFKGLSDPEVIRYYGVSYETLEATKVQLQWFEAIEKDETGKWWAICSQDNATFYGAGGINAIEKEFRKGEIGFWLLPEYWGIGIMQEVFPALCDYGFKELGLHRIEAFVETGNMKCKNAMAKVDFQHEGTLRDCEIKNEKFISLDIYSKLSGD